MSYFRRFTHNDRSLFINEVLFDTDGASVAILSVVWIELHMFIVSRVKQFVWSRSYRALISRKKYMKSCECKQNMYLTYVLCVILCVHVHHSCQQSAIPSSPCPTIFQYKHDGIEWFGMTQIQSLPLGQSTKLQVILSLRAQIPSVITFLYRSYYHLVTII